jgi:DNA polymerase elongation subunit (family B)
VTRLTYAGDWPHDPRSPRISSKPLGNDGEELLLPGRFSPVTTLSAPGRDILYLDIETTPNLGYIWDIWNDNISKEMLNESQEILCFAYAWNDEDVNFSSVYQAGGEEAMFQRLNNVLNEADAICHYNGIKHDMPHINTQLIMHGFGPPSPYKNIDLYRTIKSKFKFTYNSLDFVSKQFGLKGKEKHSGFDTWRGCMKNDPEAWAEMEKYNRQDVHITRELHKIVLPWISGHPSAALYSGRIVCPACGSAAMQRRGFSYTSVSQFQRYQCQNCGKWSRESKKTDGTTIVQDANG